MKLVPIGVVEEMGGERMLIPNKDNKRGGGVKEIRGAKNHLSILVSAVVSSIGLVVLDIVGIFIINIIAVIVKVVHVQ